MTRWGWTLGATAVTAAAAITALAVSGAAWRRESARSVSRLLDLAPPHARDADVAVDRVIDGLPAPVARYIAFALAPDCVRVRATRVRWTGEFQMRPGAGWRPFDAEQHFTVGPPGFVWDARIRMMPLVSVRVRDAYLGGQGSMLGRAGGLVTVVEEGGTPEMAAGALTRWLGEAAWFPSALVPDPTRDDAVHWEAVDDSTARATVTDGGTTVSADFHFAPTGEMTRMTALRYRDVNGAGVPTPFEGRYGDYARRDGMMIPTSAEVAWLLPEQRFPYWRGRVARVEYECARERSGDVP
jgi:hypothetical protein